MDTHVSRAPRAPKRSPTPRLVALRFRVVFPSRAPVPPRSRRRPPECPTARAEKIDASRRHRRHPVSLASSRVASPRASTSTFIGLKSQLDAIVAARASLARAARRSPSNAHRLSLHVHVVARASPSTARARAKTKRRRALPPHIHDRAPSCRERGASRDAFDREATTLAFVIVLVASARASRRRARVDRARDDGGTISR